MKNPTHLSDPEWCGISAVRDDLVVNYRPGTIRHVVMSTDEITETKASPPPPTNILDTSVAHRA